MVSNLRFIEDDESKFELDVWFQEQIKTFSRDDVSDILKSIIDDIGLFNAEPFIEDYISGVIKKDEPIFYNIHYVIDEESIPLLIDIEEIDVDDYLDNINKNKYLKSNEQDRDRQNGEDS